jgi:c-di-GMP-binding flagellar brake protein YcgR
VFVNDRPLDCVEGECASVISEHGMYIRTPRLHPLRTRLDIRMDVAGRTIRADAVVLYRHDHGEGPFGEPGMGLRFSWIAPGDREHLRTYITSRTGCDTGNGA